MNPQLQLMLQQAIQAFQSGNFDAADSILKRLIQLDAKNLPALHVLGLIKASQHNYKEAAELLGRAVRLNPAEPSIRYNLAKALVDCGLNEESIPHHKKAVELAPNNPEAWLNYGKAQSHLQNYKFAISHYDQAIRLKPDYAEAWFNKGNALRSLSLAEEVLNSYDQAIRFKPDYAEAFLNKGVYLQELKDYENAMVCLDQALSLKPDYMEALLSKGANLHILKRYEEAISQYDHALTLKPDYAEALNNKALSLGELKRYEEAVALYSHALLLQPDYPEALHNKALALIGLNQFNDAMAYFEQALMLKPDFADAWYNKGNTDMDFQRYEEAVFAYEKAISIRDDIDWVHGGLLSLNMKICSWENYEKDLARIIDRVRLSKKVIQPFPLLALTDDPISHKKCAEIYLKTIITKNNELDSIPKQSKQEKIRIGYFSADFHNHATGHLMAGLFELHDKHQFELIGFSFGPPENDEMRKRLMSAFDQFIEVGDKSDREIAQLSRTLNIDIAVDLKGYTQDSRPGIFSYRAAPIQVSYLGYPGTVSNNSMDYIIADKTLIPNEFEKYYAEKIVYLPNTYQVNDRKRIISDRVFTRQELGLPDTGFVYCCFNNNYKIHPHTFDAWMRILNRVEGSVLWLLEDVPVATENLKKEALKRGVSEERLIFAKRMPIPDHLARHRYADLFIDTFPYNAHTTASDALWAGVPVLTLTGLSFASRVAASLLNAINLSEFITDNQGDYESLAVELGKNPQKLGVIKQKLSDIRLSAPLFDTELFTRNIEKAYIKMYECYLNDLPLDHLEVV